MPGNRQSLMAQSEPNSGEPCTVEGQVVKTTTGEPLRKISVRLNRASPQNRTSPDEVRVANTDGSGHFLFSAVPAGRYTLMAGGNGYPDQVYGQGKRGSVKFLNLSPGQHAGDMVIRLTPPGVITGTVYDEDGDPVVGAQVQALRWRGQGRRRQIMGSSGAPTDDRGQYRIYGLEAGRYVIVASYQR